ncbi:MAG TPA: YtxH domain-containing protein [Candidatus Saccharimonadales bacterium]|nr:YtxH domain-containing protein [Candidatus Saccharimonadales bacterium]
MGKAQKAKRFALGTIIVAAIGYLAGLLTAPKSGKETRKDIKDTAAKTYNEAEKQLQNLHEELADLIDEVKDKGGKLSDKAQDELDDVVDKSNQAKLKARELLDAVRSGNTNDSDLKRAIKEATSAIEHLRTYLKK